MDAWIETKKTKTGLSFWIRDKRGGRQISINGGDTFEEAQKRLKLYQYKWDLIDELFGKPDQAEKES